MSCKKIQVLGTSQRRLRALIRESCRMSDQAEDKIGYEETSGTIIESTATSVAQEWDPRDEAKARRKYVAELVRK